MCFLFVPFFMPFSLFPNFLSSSFLLSAGNLVSHFTEKKKEAVRGLPEVHPWYLTTSLHLDPTTAPIPLTMTIPSHFLNDLALAILHSVFCIKIYSSWDLSHKHRYIIFFHLTIILFLGPISSSGYHSISLLHFTAKFLRRVVYPFCCHQFLFSHSLNQLP